MWLLFEFYLSTDIDNINVFFVGSREQPLTHEHKAAVVNQSRGQRLLTAGLIGQSHTHFNIRIHAELIVYIRDRLTIRSARLP